MQKNLISVSKMNSQSQIYIDGTKNPLRAETVWKNLIIYTFSTWNIVIVADMSNVHCLVKRAKIKFKIIIKQLSVSVRAVRMARQNQSVYLPKIHCY